MIGAGGTASPEPQVKPAPACSEFDPAQIAPANDHLNTIK
jgi:hypothetical protein